MIEATRRMHSRSATALLLVAVLLSVALVFLGNILPFLLAIVTLGAWYGGMRLGLAVSAVILALAVFSTGNLPGPERAGHLLTFGVLTLLIVGLTGSLNVARQNAEADSRALRLSEERYALAVQGARDGLWDWDLRTGLIYRSPRQQELVGLASDDPREGIDAFSARIHPEDRDRVLTALRDHLDRRLPYNVEYRLRVKSGEYRWFHDVGQAAWDADGRATRMAGALGDVTDRKQAEEDLRAAKEAAETAGRTKDLFLAMLSHELRTPLTPGLLAVSGLLDDPGLPAAVRPALEVIQRGIALEVRLVDDLLDLSRVASGKLRIHPERLDAHTVVRQVVAAWEGEIATGGLRLDLALDAAEHHVEADPARLQQIIANLLANAIKFTPSGGAVTVRTRNSVDCACRRGRGTCFVVEVADTGIGIEPELLERVFDAFAQGGMPRHRRSAGLGLGLAICRSLAEAHGGRLTGWSDGPARGATFQLELEVAPMLQLQKRSHAPAATPAAGEHALRILLVEDDADTLAILSRLLRRNGTEVSTARSVREALRVAQLEHFDLLISDLGLPDGSGCDLMRALGGRDAIAAIALTGYGMEDDARMCSAAGFSLHLTKPVEFPTLEAAIRRVAQGVA